MLLLNFGHPLSEPQLAQVAEHVSVPIERVVEVRTHFDHHSPFTEQARSLIEQIALSPTDWQTRRILVNPPNLVSIACLVLAELHGRMGYFPPVLRLRPVPNTIPPSFEVAEVLNLQEVREQARRQR
ncbi:MAG: hypothetical protein K2R98_09450 [Gemmataceae bacterium]|nr:hypothetical protein [Gemmataceae bacterium]